MMFKTALEAVLKHEGGYSDDPDDKGGATRFGITIGTLEMWRNEPLTLEDIRNLTLGEAESIYLTKYWRACKCDELPAPVAFVVFDGAVNHGPSRSTQLLQRAIGVGADGVIGPITLKAVQEADAEKTVDEFMVQRAMLYAKLNSKFWHGWYRRLIDMHRQAISIL